MDGSTLNRDERIFIGITGMPGSGKTTASDVVREMGYPIVSMGDIIRAETERRGLEPNPENVGRVMLMLREEEGAEAVARRVIPKALSLQSRLVLIEGIRSLHEVEEFRRRLPNFRLIAIHASPRTRFRRLYMRGRSDDPKNWNVFMERDMRELSVGLGDAIAMADFMLVNEGTKDQLRRNMRRLVEMLLKEGS